MCAAAPHSGLMFAVRITLAHFSVSSAKSLPKSAGEPPSTVPSRSASCALNLGSTSAALISLLSLWMVVPERTGGQVCAKLENVGCRFLPLRQSDKIVLADEEGMCFGNNIDLHNSR